MSFRLKFFIKYFPYIVVTIGSLIIGMLLIAIFVNMITIVNFKFASSTNCYVDVLNCLSTCDNRKICNLNITLMEPIYMNHTNNIYLVNVPNRIVSGKTICYMRNNVNPVLDNWLDIYPLLNAIKILGTNIIVVMMILVIFGIIPLVIMRCIKKMNPINAIRNMF